MRVVFRLACAAYILLVTALLLASDPAWVVGLPRRPEFPWGSFGIHWIALAVLTFLVLGLRWPKAASVAVIAGLVLYGTATELAQYFIPLRHVRWIDWGQNMLGVASGVLVYWMVRKCCCREAREPQLQREDHTNVAATDLPGVRRSAVP